MTNERAYGSVCEALEESSRPSKIGRDRIQQVTALVGESVSC